uniref:Uncharacterized protein n=1 Tax=Arundo donax TaxID=35708 RepID=A0A0A9C6C8_ARUDO
MAAPTNGPSQYTQWFSQTPLTTAGPKDTAGFMDAPSKAPPARMLAPTMKPMAMGAMTPRSPFLGSTAVAYTVYTSPKVMTISNTTAFHAPTPAESEKAPTASPPVAILRRRQATTEPSSCATQ